METFTKKELCKIHNEKLTEEERHKLIKTKPKRSGRSTKRSPVDL